MSNVQSRKMCWPVKKLGVRGNKKYLLYKLWHFKTKQTRRKMNKKGCKQSQCCSERKILLNSYNVEQAYRE